MRRLSFLLLCLLVVTVSGGQEVNISPGHLLDIFSDIQAATGSFPDDKDVYTQLSLVNRPDNRCLAVLDRKVGNGGLVGVDKCYLTNAETPELFWLRHAGHGYVSLATAWNRCVGAGQRLGALLWTGDWCEEEVFHFALVGEDEGQGVRLKHRASGRYVTAPPQPKMQAYLADDDTRLRPQQLWFICEPSGARCWPPSPPPTPPPSNISTVDYDYA